MLEKRIWYLGNALVLLLVLISVQVVFWQLVRGSRLQPVVLNPVEAAEYYREIGTEPDPTAVPAVEQPGEGEDNEGGEPAEEQEPEQDEEAEALEALMREGGLVNLQNLPQPVVQRTRAFMETIRRGSIYDRTGVLLAHDAVGSEGAWVRVYAEPAFAHIVGYTTGIRTGITGLELGYNESLLGLDRLDTRLGLLSNQPVTGSSLVLTVDAGVQRAAEEALAGRAGAVVILDGRSGAVLAMASTPRFDPNQVFDVDYVEQLMANCDSNPGCQAPFLNRASQGMYSPGSTWKTVTLMAALDSRLVTPETVFEFGQRVQGPGSPYYVYVVDGFPIPDPNHPEPRLNLEMSYAKSANAAFARMGHEMDPQTFVRYANRFGFVERGRQPFNLEIPYSPSQLAGREGDIIENNVLRAVTAIGQGELLTHPLNMAMVVLPALNDGDMPLPYFVHATHSPAGPRTIGQVRNQVMRRIITPGTARLVRGMMVTAVESGFGGQARVPGLVVGGKTGTAQLGGDLNPHAWFIGFAEDSERSVVIAVVVEHGGSGSQVAAPIFSRLAPLALQAARNPVIVTLPDSP